MTTECQRTIPSEACDPGSRTVGSLLSLETGKNETDTDTILTGPVGCAAGLEDVHLPSGERIINNNLIKFEQLNCFRNISPLSKVSADCRSK